MYLEGMGILSIKRLENVSSLLIIRWIRQMNKIILDKLDEIDKANMLKDKENIAIVEINELVIPNPLFK
jgi:hypothetical protein